MLIQFTLYLKSTSKSSSKFLTLVAAPCSSREILYLEFGFISLIENLGYLDISFPKLNFDYIMIINDIFTSKTLVPANS